MEIQYYGGNCIRLSSKKATVVIDDNLAQLGQKSILKPGDIALKTTPNIDVNAPTAKILIDSPGEYEVSGVSVHGIPARAHVDEDGKKTATVFKIMVDDIRLAVVGHVYPELNDKQLEALGTVDILIIPTGGNGYTLDSIGALKLIKKIEPKLVIPTHYADKGLKYEVPQQELSEVLKGLAMESKETVPKLKLKSSGELGEITQLIVLERQ